MNSWIFGTMPQTSLAAAILFGVGGIFLSCLQLPGSSDDGNRDTAVNSRGVDFVARDNGAVTADSSEGGQQIVASLVHNVSGGSNGTGDDEIELQFVFAAGRKAVNARISFCVEAGDAGNCVALEDQNAARVDQIARMLLNRRTSEAGVSAAKMAVSRNHPLQK